MNIKSINFYSYGAGSSGLTNIRNFLASLNIWDDVSEIGGNNKFECSYGSFKVSVSWSSTSISVNVNYGSYSKVVSGNSSYAYVTLTVCETKTATAFFVEGAVGLNEPTGNKLDGSNEFALVLSNIKNVETGDTEKGIVIVYPASTSGIYQYILASENRMNTNSSTHTIKTGNSITALFPACNTIYPGYCEHVFIPAYQNLPYASGKCIINGKTYYDMAGVLYIADD